MTVECSLTWSDISAGPFWCDWRMCSHLIRYKGCYHSLGEWRHLVSYQEASVWDSNPFWHGGKLGPPMVRCKGWAISTWWWMCSSHRHMWVLVMPFWHGGRPGPPMVIYKCWMGLSDWVRYKCWRRWRPTWRLGLQPTWEMDGSVELPVMRRIMT